jgi:hypothetical protein
MDPGGPEEGAQWLDFWPASDFPLEADLDAAHALDPSAALISAEPAAHLASQEQHHDLLGPDGGPTDPIGGLPVVASHAAVLHGPAKPGSGATPGMSMHAIQVGGASWETAGPAGTW